MGFSLSSILNPVKAAKKIHKEVGRGSKKVFKAIGKIDPISKKLMQEDPLMKNNPLFLLPGLTGAREEGKRKNPKRAEKKRIANLPINERSAITMARMLEASNPFAPSSTGINNTRGGFGGPVRPTGRAGPTRAVNAPQPQPQPQQGIQQQLGQMLGQVGGVEGAKRTLQGLKGGGTQQPNPAKGGSPQIPSTAGRMRPRGVIRR